MIRYPSTCRVQLSPSRRRSLGSSRSSITFSTVLPTLYQGFILSMKASLVLSTYLFPS